MSTVSSGPDRPNRLALSITRYSGAAGHPCRRGCGTRRTGSPATRTRLDVGLVLGGVAATREERHGDVESGVLGRLRHRAAPPRTTRSANEGIRACVLGAGLDLLQLADHLGQLVGLVGLPAQLRLQADPPPPLAPPRISWNGTTTLPSMPSKPKLLDSQNPSPRWQALSASTSASAQGITGRNDVLPSQVCLGTSGRGSGSPDPGRDAAT